MNTFEETETTHEHDNTETTKRTTFPSVREHIRESFSYLQQRTDLIIWLIGGLLVLLVVAGALLATISSLSDLLDQTGGFFAGVFFILWLFIVIIFAMALFLALQYIAVHRNENIKFREGVRWALKNIIPLAIIGVYIQLVYVAGVMFLIIPGIIAGVYLSFALYVHMKEGYRGFNALIRSTDLVRGSFWKVVWRILIVTIPVTAFFMVVGFAVEILSISGGIVEFTLSIIINILSLIFTIFMLFYMSIMLDGLVAQKPVFAVGDYSKLKILYKVAVVLGVILPIVFIATYMSEAPLSSNGYQIGGNLVTDEYRVGGGVTLTKESSGRLTDDTITMLDVWYELDWYQFTNGTYPETLNETLELPFIPDNIRYEQTGGGTGYLLCRITGPESRECVTETDVNYPYTD